VTNSRRHLLLPSYTLAPFGSPVAAFFGLRPGMVVVVGILLVFLVMLAAFLIYMLTLPSDRGRGH
jgi:hypothetical protein